MKKGLCDSNADKTVEDEKRAHREDPVSLCFKIDWSTK